jgi:multisubunit Na+/H+ antiporter MnhG subunit
MSDSYQRLHFSSIVVGLSAPLLAFAVWIETQNVQARIKVTLIVLLLFITNGILSHATGRACRVKTRGHWRLEDQDYDIALGETDQ